MNFIDSVRPYLSPNFIFNEQLDYCTFANEVADPLIKSSQYEGNRFSRTITHFIHGLKIVQADFPNRILDQWIPRLNDLLIVSEAIESNKKNPLRLSQYQSELTDRIVNLPIGEELWLPGGWSDSSGSGHALLYKILKLKNGKYRMVCFNAGDGLDFHPSLLKEAQSRHQTFLQFDQIPQHIFKRGNFIKHLLEALAPSENSQVTKDNIYLGFVGYLKQSPTNQLHPAKQKQLFIKNKRAGSCTANALYVALHYELTVNNPEKLGLDHKIKIFKTIKYFYKQQSLVSMTAKFLDKKKWNRSDHTLIKQSVRLRAKSAEKLAELGFLSETQITESRKIFEIILKELADKKRLETASNEKTELDFSVGVKHSKVRDLGFALPSTSVPVNLGKKKSDLPDDPLQVEFVWKPRNQCPLTQVQDYVAQASQLFFQINASDTESESRIVQYAINYISTLPIPSAEEGLRNLSEEEANQALKGLQGLSKMMLRGEDSEIQIHAQKTLAMYHILALTDAIARKTKSGQELLGNDDVAFAGFELFMQDHVSHLMHYDEQRRATLIYEYFTKKSFDESFCLYLKSHDKVYQKSLFSPYRVELTKNSLTEQLYRKLLAKDEVKQRFQNREADNFEDIINASLSGDPLIPQAISTLHQVTLNCVALNQSSFLESGFNPQTQWSSQVITDDKKTYIYFNSKREGYQSLKSIKKQLYRKDSTRCFLQEKYNSSSSGKKHAFGRYSLFKSPLDILLKKAFFEDSENSSIKLNIKEKNRDLQALNLRPSDQIARLLDYYSDRMDCLSQPEHQYILKKQLFLPGRLYSQLMGEPQFAVKLMRFLNRYAELFHLQKLYKEWIYFCDLAFHCQNFILDAQAACPEKFDKVLKATILKNYRVILIDPKVLVELTVPERNLLNHTLLSWHQVRKPASKDDWGSFFADYLTAHLYQNITILGQKISEIDAAEETRSLFATHRKKIDKLLWDDLALRNRCFNEVVSRLYHKNFSEQWVGKYPEFASEIYRINYRNLVIYENNEQVAQFPAQILNSTLVKSNFKNISKITLVEGLDHAYKVYDAHGLSFIFLSPLDCSEITAIHREIDGKMFQLIPLTAPSPLGSLNRPSLVHHLKIIYSGKNFSLWGGLQNPSELVATSFDNKHIYIDLEEGPKAEIYADKSKELRLVLNHPILKLLNCFEEKKWMTVWVHKKKPSQIHCIDFPRFHLNLEIREGRAYCKQLPGFYLAADQKTSFQNWENYLVFENEQNVQKLVLGKSDSFENVNRDRSFAPEIRSTFYHSNELIIGGLEYINDKAYLIPNTISEALYLFELFFLKKQYKRCHFYLDKIFAQHGYSRKNIQKIRELIHHTDHHPFALSIRLKALCLLINNLAKYSMKPFSVMFEDAELSDFAEIYVNYLSNVQNTQKFALHLEEEKDLLRLFANPHKESKFKMSSPISQRLEMVMTGNKRSAVSTPARFLKSHSTQKLSDAYDDVQLVKLLGEKLLADPFENLSFTTISEDEFEKRFSTFYHIARSGTKEQVKDLLEKLELMEGGPKFLPDDKGEYSKVVTLHELLKNLCHSPFKWFYPIQLNFVGEKRQVDRSIYHYDFKSKYCSKLQGLVGKGRKVTPNIPQINLNLRADLKGNIKNEIPKAKGGGHAPAVMELGASSIDLPFASLASSLFEQYFYSQQIPNNHQEEAWPSLQADLKEFFDVRPQFLFAYHLKNGLGLATDVNRLIDEIKLKVNQLKSELQTELNTIPPSVKDEQALQRLTNSKPLLSLDQAIDLFDLGQLEAYLKNSFLTEGQIPDLDLKIGSFLISSIRLEQFKRIQQLLQHHVSLPSSSDFKAESTALAQKIGEELVHAHCYYHADELDAQWKRLFLTFEYRNKLMLRPKQLSTLVKVIDLPSDGILNLIAILGTGSGKSKVLASLFQKIRRQLLATQAQSPALVINLWPAALYPTNKDDIRQQVNGTFKQISDTFEYSRSSASDKEYLTFLLRDLYRSLNQGKQINSTTENLQCFDLKFIELLECSSPNDDQADQSIAIFKKCLNLLLESEVHSDEPQISHSTKKEVNFTVGSPTTESLDNILLIEQIYRILIKIKKVALEDNLQHLMTDDDYTQVSQAVAEKLFIYLELENELHDDFIAYVLNRSEEIPEWISQHTKKSLIGLARGELKLLLKESLRKNTFVHYGISHEPEERGEFAKPYSANDTPVENAEYDNIHEAINKTYQTYLYTGISVHQAWKMVDHYRSKILAESRKDGLEVEQTKSFSEYIQVFPEELHQLFHLRKDDLNHIDLKKAQNMTFMYVTFFIAPMIRKYYTKLKSNAHNLRSLFRNLLGMTATPGSLDAYGSHVDALYDKGTNGQVIHELLKKCKNPEESFQWIDSSDPNIIFQKIIESNFGNNDFRMLIDIGSLFKGISNHEIAKRLLNFFNKQNSPILGVAFFHHNELMMLTNDYKVIPFKESVLKPHQRFTYCDNSHIFGADIPQIPQAKAFATFDVDDDFDKVAQGVGRLRGLLIGQKVKFGSTESTRKVIFGDRAIVTINDFLDYCKGIQAHKEKEDNLRSIKQEMRNTIRSFLRKKILSAPTVKQTRTLYKNFRSFFIETLPSDPYEMYGSIEKEVETLNHLQLLLNQLLSQVNALKGLSATEKKTLVASLKLFEPRLIELETKLPSQVLENQTELEIEVENLKNVQTENQKEIEVEKQNYSTDDLILRPVARWSPDLDLYQKGWFTPLSDTTLKTNHFAVALVKAFVHVIRMLKKVVNYITESMALAWTFIISVPAVTALAAAILIPLGLLIASVWLTRWLMASSRRKTFVAIPNIYRMRGYLDSLGDRSTAAQYPFSKKTADQILMTDNLIFSPHLGAIPTVAPFGKEMKKIDHVLVIEEKERFTLIAGDKFTDANFWRLKLKMDQQNMLNADNERKIALYDLNHHVGIVQNGGRGFTDQELQDNDQFQNLLVELKIFNGDTQFTTKQEKVLEEMVKEPSFKKKLSAFLNSVFLWREESKKAYLKSFLNVLLEG